MIPILIYLIGYIIAYIIIKNDSTIGERDWNDVAFTALLSLGSWLIVFIEISRYFKIGETWNKVFEKPPKWL